jgi:hypothetical protein
MPGVALLRLLLPDAVLVNAAVALLVALLAAWKGGEACWKGAVTILKLVFGLAGAAWLVGDSRAQMGYMLPWVWLVLAPDSTRCRVRAGQARFAGSLENAGEDCRQDAGSTFPRVFLCLTATWQSLQAYPIAGTQVPLGTMLLVVAYTVCLADALRSIGSSWPVLSSVVSPRSMGLKWALTEHRPPGPRLSRTVTVLVMLFLFTNHWCKLPALRQYHASLIPLNLPGSNLVRQQAETAALLRAQVAYLRTECDTFIAYPGFCSLYFWAEKPPPTQLNSTGWGQLSHAQQQQIIAALRRARRALVVADESLVKRWEESIPEPIRPMVQFVTQECRPVHRIRNIVFYAPLESPNAH